VNSRFQCASETKLQIICVAGELIHKGGAESTTINEIVEAAGVAKTEFRHYFRCKQDLIVRSFVCISRTSLQVGTP
jgi:AcrR family transcriptional regulator